MHRKFFWQIGAVFLLSLTLKPNQVSANINCESLSINWEDSTKAYASLRVAYLVGEFVKLDKSLDCLVFSERRFPSGETGAAIAYKFYREAIHDRFANQKDETKISEWENQAPNSKYVSFARLRKSYMHAWDARGNKFSKDTSKKQFKEFHKLLTETEAAILSNDNALIDTPLSQQLLLAISLDLENPQVRHVKVFLSGIKKWPYYYNFYHVFLSRLTPKWGGSWSAVNKFIEHFSEQRDDSLYARLYIELHDSGAEIDDMHLTWEKLKPSLTSLISKYPTNQHRKIAASYACYFDDKEYYSTIDFEFQKITGMSEQQWVSGIQLEECNTRFSL